MNYRNQHHQFPYYPHQNHYYYQNHHYGYHTPYYPPMPYHQSPAPPPPPGAQGQQNQGQAQLGGQQQSQPQGSPPAHPFLGPGGSFDFQKAVGQFEEMVKTVNQVSPIMKQIGALFTPKK